MTKTCATCGKEFKSARSTAKFCSSKCRYHNHLASKKRITIPSDLRFSILRRDKFRCRYCGAEPGEKQLFVDHVKSIADGGARTNPKNLVTTCRLCNAGKSDTSLAPEEVPRAAA
jgi:5-methylcytosine-specific restriction endonuclease McrA